MQQYVTCSYYMQHSQQRNCIEEEIGLFSSPINGHDGVYVPALTKNR